MSATNFSWQSVTCKEWVSTTYNSPGQRIQPWNTIETNKRPNITNKQKIPTKQRKTKQNRTTKRTNNNNKNCVFSFLSHRTVTALKAFGDVIVDVHLRSESSVGTIVGFMNSRLHGVAIMTIPNKALCKTVMIYVRSSRPRAWNRRSGNCWPQS